MIEFCVKLLNLVTVSLMWWILFSSGQAWNQTNCLKPAPWRGVPREQTKSKNRSQFLQVEKKQITIHRQPSEGKPKNHRSNDKRYNVDLRRGATNVGIQTLELYETCIPSISCKKTVLHLYMRGKIANGKRKNYQCNQITMKSQKLSHIYNIFKCFVASDFCCLQLSCFRH